MSGEVFQQACKVGVAVIASALWLSNAPVSAAEPLAPRLFDPRMAQSAKHSLGPRLRASASSTLSAGFARNLKRDAGSFTQSTLGGKLSARLSAELAQGTILFVRAQARLGRKITQGSGQIEISKAEVRQLWVAPSSTNLTQLTLGRFRLRDPHQWLADCSVDGLHLSGAIGRTGLEFAIVRASETGGAVHALLHASRADDWGHSGVLAALGQSAGATQLHIAGYLRRELSPATSLTALVGLSTEGAGGTPGLGLDLRLTRALGDGRLKPRLVVGIAAGTRDFRQTGLHSNKTKADGQMQVHRYGTVFQPELTNLAVGTLSLALRPSRRFSADLSLYAYAQVKASRSAPKARLHGKTTGTAQFLGSEIDLSVAWRPTKKTKLQLGLGHFQPGPAFLDQRAATRIHLQLSRYF